MTSKLVEEFLLLVKLTDRNTHLSFVITSVYDPCSKARKGSFLQEIRGTCGWPMAPS